MLKFRSEYREFSKFGLKSREDTTKLPFEQCWRQEPEATNDVKEGRERKNGREERKGERERTESVEKESGKETKEERKKRPKGANNGEPNEQRVEDQNRKQGRMRELEKFDQRSCENKTINYGIFFLQ